MNDRTSGIASSASWRWTRVLAALLTTLAIVLAGCSSLGKNSGQDAASERSSAPVALEAATARATTQATPRRAIRALCVTNGNVFLRAGLLDDYFEVVTVTPAEYPVSRGAFDVTVFDRVAPAVAPSSGSVFYIRPSGPSSPVDATVGTLSSNDNYTLGFDTVTKASPLLRWVHGLEDTNIAEAIGVVPRTGDQVIGASVKGPLLVAGTRGGRRFVVLTFDLLQSDLPMRPAWPILLANTISDLVGKDVYSLRVTDAAPPARSSSTETPRMVGGPDGPTNKDIIQQVGQIGFGGPSYRKVYGQYRTAARDQLEHQTLPAPVKY